MKGRRASSGTISPFISVTEDEKHRLAEMAEEICTVSNTLRGEPQFDLKVS